MKTSKVIAALLIAGLAVSAAASHGRELSQAAAAKDAKAADAKAADAAEEAPANPYGDGLPTVTVSGPSSIPSFAAPTFKYAYKDGVGAFQAWNGGIELPKVIDLGGVRVTRPGLRGRRLSQAAAAAKDAKAADAKAADAEEEAPANPYGDGLPTVTVSGPSSIPSFAAPTFKYAYKDGVGAFQAWNGGIELPKVIDLGGVRVTRPGLRGRRLSQAAAAAKDAKAADAKAADAEEEAPANPYGDGLPTVTVSGPSSIPSFAAPTFKYAYKDGVGAFQAWNGGIELPKVIDLGGVRVTRPGLRGRRLSQAAAAAKDAKAADAKAADAEEEAPANPYGDGLPTVTVSGPSSIPSFAAPTFKYAYKDGVGAFQAWNGGIELPKVIDLGGVRVTRPGLRGRRLSQAAAAAKDAKAADAKAADAEEEAPANPYGDGLPTVTVSGPSSIPSFAAPTFKYAYKDGVGAFQAWNGGIELPKVIDLGGVRVTRPGLRGRRLSQAAAAAKDAKAADAKAADAEEEAPANPYGDGLPTVTVSGPSSIPSFAAPTFKYAYKDGVGAFQAWNGGIELPKVIDLGGVRDGWLMDQVRRHTGQQHAWTRLQRDLARTLGSMYSLCEADGRAGLVEAAVADLEELAAGLRQLQPGRCCGCDAAGARDGGCQQAAPCARQPGQHRAGGGGGSGALGRSLPGPHASRLSVSSSAQPPPPPPRPRPPPGVELAGAAVAELPAHQHSDDGSDDAGRGGDTCSSCSSTSTFSSSASKGSSASSLSPGLAWRRVFDASALADPGAVPGLHHKLSSPDRLRKTPSETKAAAEERQARAERLRAALAEERLTKLKQEQLTKQQRRAAGKDDAGGASAAAARSADKHQRSEALRAAHIGRIKAKAGDEARKVEEVTFINTLNTEGKKADLQQRLEDGEARRAEALAAILAKQHGAALSVREAAERRRAAEAERLAALAERQRRKQEAQAKIELERRAAAAAREAAKAAARDTALQREAARQQQAAWLSGRTSARLKEAAQRRLRHLSMIRERAALGKDFERRDSFTGSPAARWPSAAALPAARPAAGGATAAGVAAEQERQQPRLHEGRPPVAPAGGGGGTSQSLAASLLGGPAPVSTVPPRPSKLNAAAPCFLPTAAGSCPAPGAPSPGAGGPGSAGADASLAVGRPPSGQLSRPHTPAGSSPAATPGGSRGASPAPVSPAAAPLPGEVLAQLQGHSQSIAEAGITPASSLKSSIKGARRRMAKARRKLLEQGGCFSEPDDVMALSCSAEAQQLLAAWAPHLALLNVQPPQLRYPQAAAAAGATAAVAAALHHGTLAQQACCADGADAGSPALSGRSTSNASSGCAGCSPGKQPGARLAGSSPCHSRCSSCAGCGGQRSGPHSPLSGGSSPFFSGGGSTPFGRTQQAERRDALAALVNSARAALGRQPLLVCHLARQTGLLHLVCKEALAATGSSVPGAASAAAPADARAAAAAEAKARQARLLEARLLGLLLRLLELPMNRDYLLASGPLLPAFGKAALAALDHCNSLEADEPAMATGGEAAARLSMLLQVVVSVLEHDAPSADLVAMQEELVGFMVAAGTIRRLANVFSLFDQPVKDAARAVPPHVLQARAAAARPPRQPAAAGPSRPPDSVAPPPPPPPPPPPQSLRLLRGLTAVRDPPAELLVDKRWPAVSPNAAAIVMDLQATAMAGVLSLLTAVLLNAAPTCTPAEASSKALPPNFVEAAHLVMAVLTNVCALDLLAAQHMLSCAHNRLELWHLLSFLLSYATSRWPAAAPRGAAAGLAPAREQAAAPGQAGQARSGAAPLQEQQGQQGQQQQQEQQQGQQQGQQQQQALPSQQQGAGAPAAGGGGGGGGGSSLRADSAPGAGLGAGPGGGAPCCAASAGAHHPIALLLNEVLLLVGSFCVLHPSNQAMLQWGRSPGSILQRLCAVPAPYFDAPALRAIALPTLLAVAFRAERTCDILTQHCSPGLLDFVREARRGAAAQPAAPAPAPAAGTAAAGAAAGDAAVGRQQAQQPAGADAAGRPRERSGDGGSRAPPVPPRFALARRFPLALLDEAEEFFERHARAGGGV
ncbi:hypothetical protein HT031_000299 [Scenedesmus sp. PABB004]|nr:hypothetical protein HT031_000299 [Scenedesmus sp. PABB004]